MTDIPSVTLGLDDVLVVNVGVGNLPQKRAEEYMEIVRVKIKDVFGDKQPMLFFPLPESKCVDFAVIQRC